MTDTTTSAVERLAVALDGHHRVEAPMLTGCCREAAATLRALAAERDRLREALAPFASYMTTEEGRIDLDNKGVPVPDSMSVGWVYLTHGDFRAAEAALEATNE